jgi:hypothetical protein
MTSSMRKGRVVDPLTRKKEWERKIRHASRSKKLKALPRVKEGRLLDDDSRRFDCRYE